MARNDFQRPHHASGSNVMPNNKKAVSSTASNVGVGFEGFAKNDGVPKAREARDQSNPMSLTLFRCCIARNGDSHRGTKEPGFEGGWVQ